MAAIVERFSDYSGSQLPQRILWPGQFFNFRGPNGRRVEVDCLENDSATVVVSRTYKVEEVKSSGLRGLWQSITGEIPKKVHEVGMEKHTLRQGMSWEFHEWVGLTGGLESINVRHQDLSGFNPEP